ncbi:uncharacterized protein LOC112569551 [Pomacea canaliculata]|uniref:uncharacterized protein LOC112569551 n=1 Tax=Pomacea canaliculata TaxID=400727 RepID=UPI000D734665|nr:uncharacterized protein LOC112569551 [Pomacea canaliculata]XP_025103144.1 uncharacterized protein LOC112569551 [Pomacea canaliculata]
MTVEQAAQNNQTAGDRQLLAYGAKDRAVCDIPPTDVNSTVTLTCYFPADVSVNKKNFIVYHSVTTQAPVAVINATWYEGQYLFSLAPGFGLEGSQSDGRAFTFYILQVSKGHNGMYSCNPDGYHDGDIKGCELVLNKSGSESVDSHEQKGNSTDCSNHSKTTDIYFILFIIATVLSVCIPLVCLIFVLRR